MSILCQPGSILMGEPCLPIQIPFLHTGFYVFPKIETILSIVFCFVLFLITRHLWCSRYVYNDILLQPASSSDQVQSHESKPLIPSMLCITTGYSIHLSRNLSFMIHQDINPGSGAFALVYDYNYHFICLNLPYFNKKK